MPAKDADSSEFHWKFMVYHSACGPTRNTRPDFRDTVSSAGRGTQCDFFYTVSLSLFQEDRSVPTPCGDDVAAHLP